MDYLPEELIANVISHLADEGKQHDDGIAPPHVPLAPYATVSRRWQQRIEAITFAHITVSPPRLASPITAQALTADRLCRFVRSVQVDVMLSPYDERARAYRENEAERAYNDEVFTGVIQKVFALMSSSLSAAPGTDGETHHPRIHLSMKARCISDTEDLEARRYRRHIGATGTEDIFEARYESSYLELRPQITAEGLPELYGISQFHVEATYGLGHRHFAPQALCLLASRMPGLERVRWELCDNERRNIPLRKKLREDFANALHTLPSTLKHFNLLYDRRIPSDHSYQTPSIVDTIDEQGTDKLSIALHKFSQSLTTCDLIATVGPEVLWPLESDQKQQQDKSSSPPPLWPNMRRYNIDPGPIAPTGEWRFRRPSPGDNNTSGSDSDSDDGADSYVSEYHAAVTAPGDEKEDPFREELDPDVVGPLLLAAARAAGQMPTLHSMFLTLDPPIGGDSGRLEVSYTTGCRRAGAGADDGGDTAKATLLVESYPEFHPDVEVLQAWRQAASNHMGPGSRLEITIKDSMDWSL